ncbi:collagen binding domain-containing protein [Streptococcus sp. DAT741]|nr:collagen binding domain-containing protein [Streptococcus sp. DAT741]QHF55534.1 Gamma-glutamyltranspeptidase [Streptococcus sp. DAT741]
MEQLLKNRFVKTLLIIFLPLLFITALFNPIKIVKAADVSSNVTSLTVSPSQINDGGKTTVRFTFDEHSQKINSGDTIRVNWQNSGTVYGSGFKKTIRLMIGGEYVGDMIISDGEAVVTFNEGVKGLQNITGWGEFEIQGRDMTQTSDEHSGTFTINSGGQSVVVTVKKGASGTVGVFYYKTGDMLPEDTEHVRWFLNINNEKAYVDSDIRIEDEIQPGQTLDLNSFDITVGGYKPGHYYGSDAINKFIKDFPGSSISVDATTGKISVLITQGYASLSNFSIMYKTKVDNSEQQTFENHTKAWYKENGKDAIEGKEFNHSVVNVKADGGADGNKPTTTTEEPTTTTTTEEPTTTTTTEEPTTTTTTEEPTTTTTTEEPTTTTTTEEPTTTTTTEEPTTTTTTEEPTTTTTTEEPTTTTTTEEPTTTTTTEEPTTTTTTEELTTTTTTEEPTTTTTTEEPTTTTTIEEPTTTTTTSEKPSQPETTTNDKSRKASLPSTGEVGSFLATMLGFGVLVSIITAMVYHRKSKNH